MRTLILLLLCINLSYASEISVRDTYPLIHGQTFLTVRDDEGVPIEGLKLQFTFRPNSMVERSVILDAETDSLGTVMWAPDDAGICSIIAYDPVNPDSVVATTDVSIRFRSFSPQGIVVLTVAFLVLFGGATWSIVMLFRP